MRRTLVLKKETLAELTTVELGAVNGGQATPNCPPPPTSYCASMRLTCLVGDISAAMEPCLVTYDC